MGKKSAPTEVAPVPGFFGHVVKPGQPLKWANEVEDFCMQLNSAALGADATKGRSTLSVVAKTSKIALCTLTPEVAEQWNLMQTFTPMDGAIEFVVDGPNAIHITGFIEVEDEEDSGDEHDFDDMGSEDEEMMVFGGEGDSSDDEDVDEDDEEEEELSDEAKKNRFEVLEERVHSDKPEGKKSPKKSPKKEVKKEAAAKKAAAAAAEAEKKAVEEELEKKKAKAAKHAEKEKKTAEKLAEVTASSAKSKKRAAPAESVEVPKKAKVATRVHKGVTIEDV
ncbi:unnamed protein product [Phytophthora fragariaefolia]|uniref:Unnamed protein product n=1 Tax=Phytophthora fragariaefolia TaxID=1490495 RepID=A0A9W7CV83_9STRA|nr:unnamed protein product [Phytophthora fragariaefolia]